MSTTADNSWSNPEKSAERRPLLDVEQLRITEITEGVRGLVEAGRNEHRIGLETSGPVIEEKDMAAYTGITPNQNPIYNEVTPDNVAQISEYVRSIARSSEEQRHDTAEAA